MKKRLLELLVIYIIYFATLLFYIYLHVGSIRTALGSIIIWLIPFIVILPTQFIAFIIGVGWPINNDKIDTRIYRITHLVVYLLIVLLAFK